MAKIPGTLTGRISAVVVHHKSYDSIIDTVSRIVEGGVDPSRIVVVDNGEDREMQTWLLGALPAGIETIFTENRGYGAAVNLGVQRLRVKSPESEFVLVSTHECRPAPDAINALAVALSTNTVAGVAGPTLVSGSEGFVWSAGGYLTPQMRLPRHFRHRELSIPDSVVSPEVRDWLDGAFLLYRTEAIARQPISENYFMYMEEVDHHLSLKRTGWAALWVPRAKVWQSSGGIPPYYLARNMQMFQRRFGTIFSRMAATPWSIAYRAASNLVNQRSVAAVVPMLKGWRDGIGQKITQDPGVVVIVNPLGSALNHYQAELTDVLEAVGVDVEMRAFDEPSQSGGSRLKWLLKYLQTLWSARGVSGARAIIVLWPPLGFLDVALTRVLGGSRAHLVMHDPVPLVRAVGFDKVSRLVARAFLSSRLIAHSIAATEAVSRQSGLTATLLPHPVLAPRVRPALSESKRVVRVLGQYKPDRDIRALAELATQQEFEDVTFEIIGRGWPEIDGWSVRAEFISEEEFGDALDTADVVVIPYTKFFQSGVAVRCLERGVRFVGPRGTALDDLVGLDTDVLTRSTDPTDWVRALDHALSGAVDQSQVGAKVRSNAVDAWSKWVSQQ